MRRIIVSMNVTVDGFMADADGGLDWQFNNWNSDMARLLGEQLSNTDTILLGRNTYQAMANYWPTVVGGFGLSRDDIAYATLMNDYPKIVCSTTIKKARWNNSKLINGNILGAVTKLKQQAGKDIMIYGSRTLVQYLAQKKLVDELQLWVYPVVLSRGLSLFKQNLNMNLLSSHQFSSGVVLLTYEFQKG
jgi:dihydrofolate reductase